jgi:hypothetical protein
MDIKQIKSILKTAEKAAKTIGDKEMRLKAFEIVLSSILRTPQLSSRSGMVAESPKPRATVKQTRASSTSDRILLLRDEGFFVAPRTLAQVREELKRHAWHYPLTTLSGPIANLVSKRELRRVREKEGKKSVWKYAIP